MPATQVNPTRMELTRLKKRQVTAVRGHKLLKDKRDEMVRQFILMARQNKELREEVERELSRAMEAFLMARAVMRGEMLQEAIMTPARSLELRAAVRNVMSVEVPTFQLIEGEGEGLYPYGMLATSPELDAAMEALAGVLPKLVRLAEAEKSCERLATEIEKTRRRVNALEYVMIPQMAESIRTITMRLSENERGNLTRLMKVKDMIAARDA